MDATVGEREGGEGITMALQGSHSAMRYNYLTFAGRNSTESVRERAESTKP